MSNKESRFLRSKVLILGVLILFNVLAWIGVFQLNQPYLEVTFFDVGQGDSILTEWTQYIPSYLRLNFLA
ncbi:MAG: hypothetical protein A3D46_00140 [Candidatus Nealsonbacteria bacterium RIFCSPHIGHO2_02_FULL_43_13]|uniref:Uncharacterized protein n=1 Tax=Candidatus Nealsonbacteria bacterium RIFCSPHIGHO2_02_FULL_43_13 TaxID=1801668 RepID=A0A1G2E7C2_9BACT|nr:MAG: hypothetical protein A3D46_00140 [Candidatus Nealsonbacteria bacterium RIFCSPHIGHO2_02_FULL_43_13]